MHAKRLIRLALLVAASIIAPLSRAEDYSIRTQKISIPVPDGFIALSHVDPNNFAAYYQKADPNLQEFYCYVKEPAPQGACNAPRSLKLIVYRQFAGI